MPFKSEKQKEYLRRKEPLIYKRWVKEYGNKPRKKKSK